MLNRVNRSVNAINPAALIKCNVKFSLPSELAERNSTKIGHMLEINYNLKTEIKLRQTEVPCVSKKFPTLTLSNLN